jgi:dCMP deaminase
MQTNKWHNRYLDLAKSISSWSKDPNTKVGAVIIGDKGQILSQGYNGFPRGILDTEERLNEREIKLSFIVHAEMNAIYNATYSGICLDNSTLYVYGLPICSECAKGIIQVGISKIVIPSEFVELRKEWTESWYRSNKMFNEANIKVEIL